MDQAKCTIPTPQPIAETPLVAAARAEIDIQIATAKRYPRDIDAALTRILTIATLDEETAADCFYSLRRGAGQGAQIIEGISVRLAEIIAGAWGNLRAQTFITSNDGRIITATAICHDLETNYAVSLNVQRSITDRYGRTYNPDMQVVTGNAAMAIAFRNAVLKVVPKAVTGHVVNQIREVAVGRVRDLTASRRAMVDYFINLGVTQPQLLEYLGVTRLEAVDAHMVMELRGLANALKEGTASIDNTFPTAAASDAAATASAATAKRLMEKAFTAQRRATKPKDGTITPQTDTTPRAEGNNNE